MLEHSNEPSNIRAFLYALLLSFNCSTVTTDQCTFRSVMDMKKATVGVLVLAICKRHFILNKLAPLSNSWL